MNNAIISAESPRYKFDIFYDECPECPMNSDEAFDHIKIYVANHRHTIPKAEDVKSFPEISKDERFIAFRIYRDGSFVWETTDKKALDQYGPYDAMIVMNNKEYMKWSGCKKEHLGSALRSLYQQLSDWASGQVYGFIRYQPFTRNGHVYYEEKDSCWGFFGRAGLESMIETDAPKCLRKKLREEVKSY
jgi:hypothetical protein